MPLQFSAAHSSRITKSQRKNPLSRRASSSPFTGHPRRKPIQRSKSGTDEVDQVEEIHDDILEDARVVNSLAAELSLQNVLQAIHYANTHMFEEIPEAGGFNSTRTAEILNFRKSLAPMLTVAHIHALCPSPTGTERELSELTKKGTIRRLNIPGRGSGGSSIGEGVCFTEDFKRLVNQTQAVTGALAEKLLELLRTAPTQMSIPDQVFSMPEISLLMRSGFATSSSQYQNTLNVLSNPLTSTSGLSTSILSASRAAAGSLAAVGGEHAVFGAGGRGGMRQEPIDVAEDPAGGESSLKTSTSKFQISLPGTGMYLKLLSAARSHLISLVNKTRTKQIPSYLLREKWDGGVSPDDPAAAAKTYRGEFVGVLPARTRKWRQFYGLSFNFVLAECLGGGLIELFDTKSVGMAVRAT